MADHDNLVDLYENLAFWSIIYDKQYALTWTVQSTVHRKSLEMDNVRLVAGSQTAFENVRLQQSKALEMSSLFHTIFF